jgi:hypothetical protein
MNTSSLPSLEVMARELPISGLTDRFALYIACYLLEFGDYCLRPLL